MVKSKLFKFKLTVAHLFKKFVAFYRNQKFITVFRISRYRSILSQSNPFHILTTVLK